MKHIITLVLAVLLLLGVNTNATTPDPQSCYVTIKGTGTPPDGWSIQCPHNFQHVFHWDGTEYSIHADDTLQADYGITGTTSGITIKQYVQDSCVCYPYQTTYAYCQQVDSRPRQPYVGTTWFSWRVICGWCSGFCCGSYATPTVIVYNNQGPQ